MPQLTESYSLLYGNKKALERGYFYICLTLSVPLGKSTIESVILLKNTVTVSLAETLQDKQTLESGELNDAAT